MFHIRHNNKLDFGKLFEESSDVKESEKSKYLCAKPICVPGIKLCRAVNRLVWSQVKWQ